MSAPDASCKTEQDLPRFPVPPTPPNLTEDNPSLPRLFSLADYDRSDQFDVWRRRMSNVWNVSRPPGGDPADGFTAEYVHANLGNLIFCDGRVDPYVLESLVEPARKKHLAQWFLMLCRSGEAHFQFGSRELRAGPGDLFLIPLDENHRGLMNNFEAISITLPRSELTEVAAAIDSASGTILSGPLARLLADYLTNLSKRLLSMSESELIQAGRATFAMVSACILPSRSKFREAQRANGAVLFDRATSYIRRHLSNPDLTSELLAQELGVSRTTLYRAFERMGGVAYYIQRSRLQAGRAALVAHKGRRIQDIAYSVGFRFAADFGRAFRREFGISPREARLLGSEQPLFRPDISEDD